MHASILLVLWGGVSLVLFYTAFLVYTSFQRRAKAKGLGCEPPVTWRGGGFLGINLLRRMMKADKAGKFTNFMVDRYNELSAEIGRPATTFQFTLFGTTNIHTTDPKNIQALLATQFPVYGLGSDRRNNMIALLGDGIFVQDGKPWEHSRAMLRPNFVRDQVSDLDLSERHVQHLIKALPTTSTSNWTQISDVQVLFFRLTLDSATEFLFGESVNSQLANLPTTTSPTSQKAPHLDEQAFAHAFDNGQRHLAQRFRLANLYWLHNPTDFQSSIAQCTRFIDHFVTLALREPTSAKAAEEGAAKSKYVFLAALAQQTRDPVELRAQLLNILLAGRDTTASLLSYVFHHLVRHPDVYAKLRSTVTETFGSYDAPRNISFASLKGCTYLTWVLNETLRLNTVVPGNGRTALKDSTLPRGGGKDGTKPVFVPKGTLVEYSIHVMQRRKDLWGMDAEEWRPERWEGKRPGWEFLPFNGGPRICIGQQFALIEASHVIVRLLQRFDKIEPAGDELEMDTANLTLTCCPGKGPVVRLHEATD